MSRSARAVADVAAEYGVSWWSVHQGLVRVAASRSSVLPPVRVLGLDETRARSVRWAWSTDDWRRSNPWMTSFVDLDTGRRGRLADPAWAHRRLLLAASDRLGAHGLARLRAVFRSDDPMSEIAAAWAVKQRLRQLLAVSEPADIRHRLFRF